MASSAMHEMTARLCCQNCKRRRRSSSEVILLSDGKVAATKDPPVQEQVELLTCRQHLAMSQVFDVPEIVQALGIASCDPFLLVPLSLTQSHLHSVISSTKFAAHVADELHDQGFAWAQSCRSLEEIALGMAVERICAQPSKNHLYFQYGGGTEVRPVSRPLLDIGARLGLNHPRLQFHIDSHVGRGAPAGMAMMYSQIRANSVKNELISRGIAEERTTIRAWGRRVSMRWSEPEDDTAARAEMFFSLGGMQFPVRPAYYNLVPEDLRPQVGRTEGGQASSSDDEGILPILAVRRLIQARQRNRQVDQQDEDQGPQVVQTEVGQPGSSDDEGVSPGLALRRLIQARQRNRQVGQEDEDRDTLLPSLFPASDSDTESDSEDSDSEPVSDSGVLEQLGLLE